MARRKAAPVADDSAAPSDEGVSAQDVLAAMPHGQDDGPQHDEPIESQEDGSQEDAIEEAAGSAEPSEQSTTPAPQTETQQQANWRAQLGQEFATLTDEQAVARLQAQLAQAQQAQQWQYIAAQRDGELRAIQQWQAQQAQIQQQQQFQAQQEAEAAKRKWEKKPYDPTWLTLLNEDGTPKNGVDPSIPGKIREFAMWREQILNKLVDDPDSFIRERGFVTPAEVQQSVQQAIGQFQEQLAIRDFESQYAEVLYVPGTREFTQVGSQIVNTANQFINSGMPQSQALQMAADMVRGQVAQTYLHQGMTAQTQQQVAQTTNAKLKQDVIARGAARRPNRDGSFPRTETRRPEPQNGSLDFSSMARDAFKDEGLWTEDDSLNFAGR